jgi:mannitol-1-phosphate 5-dehydrogenase
VKAVVLGAGRIGCGLAGHALRSSGHEVAFITRTPALAAHFNRVGAYRVRLSDCREAREDFVEGVRGVCVDDVDGAVHELAAADLIAVCVQAHCLPGIAPLIAAALRRRSEPANVLAFQNLASAGRILRRLVASHLPSGWPVDEHGFSGALAARVVSRCLGDPAGHEPLTFLADPPAGFVVDRQAVRGVLPPIAGIVATGDYAAAVRQKLFIFSAGHAAAAYLGSLKGYHYIHTAVRDAEIRSAVVGAMAEGRRALGIRPGMGCDGVESDPIEIVARFDNAALDDPVARVGRDPLRKLGPADRLIGPALLAENIGAPADKLALAAAAALCFEDPRDVASVKLQRRLRRCGVKDVMASICLLDPSGRVGRRVAHHWLRLSAGGQPDNLLLSLDQVVWSWAPTNGGSVRPKVRVGR